LPEPLAEDTKKIERPVKIPVPNPRPAAIKSNLLRIPHRSQGLKKFIVLFLAGKKVSV